MKAFLLSISLCFLLRRCFAEGVELLQTSQDNNDGLLVKLLDEFSAMQTRVEKLERSEQNLKGAIQTLLGTTGQLRLQLDEVDKRLVECEAQSNQEINYQQHGEVKHTLIRGVRQLAGMVSFTAYLDHVLTNLGKEQPIVFNQILLNDGRGYNSHSGIFHAPVAGVYLFSWAVTARHTGHSYDVWAKLVVNGDHKVGTVAESRANLDDNQSSNTAVLRVNEGDEVWVAHYSAYPDVYGADNERTTSFTGVLLYQEE